jgi:hypothetical protein
MLCQQEKAHTIMTSTLIHNIRVKNGSFSDILSWSQASGLDPFDSELVILSNPEQMDEYFSNANWKYFDSSNTVVICDQFIEPHYLVQFFNFLKSHQGTFFYCGDHDLSAVIENSLTF